MFLEIIFPDFEVKHMVISDRGPHFIDRRFQRFLSDHGVRHNVMTPYHPQTSGQVETSNKQIKNILMRWGQHGKISYLEHYGLTEQPTKHLLECHHTNSSMGRHVTYLSSWNSKHIGP